MNKMIVFILPAFSFIQIIEIIRRVANGFSLLVGK